MFIKNNIVVLRRVYFSVIRILMNIIVFFKEVFGFEVNFENVVVWVIREMRLYGLFFDDIIFNLKIDGRFFYGKCI